jgi:1-acyl-sn-glycerol-3-phosphate acyltransferase
VTFPSYHWWRTVFFLIPAIAVYSIVLGTISVLSSFVDRSGRFAHGLARVWSRLILVTTGVQVEVTGLEQLTPGTTYLFVSNHQSIYDIPVVFWALPFQLRIIAKQSLGSFPFLGWHLRRTGHLLVDRRHPDAPGILERWRQLLGDGLSLIIFPEGTRSADGRVGRFKAGSFLLAMEAGLPIVPLSITGTRFVMRKGFLTTRPGRVRLTVHAPVSTSEGPERPDTAAARRLGVRVRSVVEARVAAEDLGLGTWPSN